MLCVGWTRIEITRPKVKPVYVNSGGTLNLTCEVDDRFDLQWHRALYDGTSSGSLGPYKVVDASSDSGFVMTASKTDGRGSTVLTKVNMSVADAGSYRCSRRLSYRTSYTVDVNVLQGQSRHCWAVLCVISLCCVIVVCW